MNKMNKKVIAVITAIMLLATCLTGCGGGGDKAADPARISFASGGTSGTD